MKTLKLKIMIFLYTYNIIFIGKKLILKNLSQHFDVVLENMYDFCRAIKRLKIFYENLINQIDLNKHTDNKNTALDNKKY